jgi:hypothetical protein
MHRPRPPLVGADRYPDREAIEAIVSGIVHGLSVPADAVWGTAALLRHFDAHARPVGLHRSR